MKQKTNVYLNSFNTMDMVDEETKKIIKDFKETESVFMSKARKEEEYNKLLQVFSKDKSVKRICHLIKTLYNDLKSGNIPNKKNTYIYNDEEINEYEKNEIVAKYIITLSIDSLNGLLLSLNKATSYEMDNIRVYLDRKEMTKEAELKPGKLR